MTPRKPKPDDDDVQKVRIEDVGPKAKEAHEKAVRSSIFSEKVLLSFFGAIVAISTLGQMYLQYQTKLSVDAAERAAVVRDADVAAEAKKIAVKAEQAANKVEIVKETLHATTKKTEVKLNDLARVAADTHVLVNNNMMIQLKLNAELSRWKADQTKNPVHEAAAVAAENLLREHEKKQATVDATKEN